MPERDTEGFDIDEEFLAGAEDGTDYERLLDKVDKRVRTQGKRGKAAWSRLARDLDPAKLSEITHEIGLGEVIAAGAQILAGQVRGRIVVKIL